MIAGTGSIMLRYRLLIARRYPGFYTVVLRPLVYKEPQMLTRQGELLKSKMAM